MDPAERVRDSDEGGLQAGMIFDVENVLMHHCRAFVAQFALAIDNQFKQVLKNRWSLLKMSKA